jgi:hypothetical protein
MRLLEVSHLAVHRRYVQQTCAHTVHVIRPLVQLHRLLAVAQGGDGAVALEEEVGNGVVHVRAEPFALLLVLDEHCGCGGAFVCVY